MMHAFISYKYPCSVTEIKRLLSVIKIHVIFTKIFVTSLQMKVMLLAAFVAVTSAVPMNFCKNYKYLYDQCLPKHSWICDKPLDYTPLDM